MNVGLLGGSGCRRLVADLGSVHRCLSSAVLRGGPGRVRTWLDLQVPPGYARTDPAAHLREESADLEGPVVGMMTAAPVAAYADVTEGVCRVVATCGVRHALAACATRPRPVAPPLVPPPGTINLLVVVRTPLSRAALVGALGTAVEAKAQALAAARIPASNADGWATGTATDAVCVACPYGRGAPFAGPATAVGGDIGRAVLCAVLDGIAAGERAHRDRVSGPVAAPVPRSAP